MLCSAGTRSSGNPAKDVSDLISSSATTTTDSTNRNQVLSRESMRRHVTLADFRSGSLVPLVDSKERFVCFEDLNQLGQLKLVVCGSQQKITVTVLGVRYISCQSDKKTSVYVKISIFPDDDARLRHKTTPQNVIEGAATLHEDFAFNVTSQDSNRRLLVSVWSRTTECKSSTFIGCLSFGVRGIVTNQAVVQGWFYLLRGSLGRRKHLKVTNSSMRKLLTPNRRYRVRSSSRLSRQDSIQPHATLTPPCGGTTFSTLPSRGRQARKARRNLEDTAFKKVYAGCQCKFCHGNRDDSSAPRDDSCPLPLLNDLQLVKSSGKRRKSSGGRQEEEMVQNKRRKMPSGYSQMQSCSPDVDNSRWQFRDILKELNSTSANNHHLQDPRERFRGSRSKQCRVPILPPSPVELREAEVQRKELRSARIVTPVLIGFKILRETTNTKEEKSPSPKEDRITDDFGYHSDEASKENCPRIGGDPEQQNTEEKKGFSSHFDSAALDVAITKSKDRRRLTDAGLKPLAQRSRSTRRSNIRDGEIQLIEADQDDKSKTNRLSAIKSWIQRKTTDTSVNPKQEGSLSRSTSFKRASSLRRSKRDNCDSCFSTCLSLNDLLSKKGGTTAFRAFLQTEFSEENLDFWQECESLKRNKGAKIHKVATKIYERFFVDDSPSEINIDSESKNEVRSKLGNPDPAMFDRVQTRIFELMEKDSFRRFLVSEFAHRCRAHS